MSKVNLKKALMFLMILSTTVSTMAGNKNDYPSLVRNNYPSSVRCEITWKSNNPPNVKKEISYVIEPGQSIGIKAPISTYHFYEIKVYTTNSGPKGKLMLCDQLAHGHNHFVISKDGNISGFKNKDEYQKSLEAA